MQAEIQGISPLGLLLKTKKRLQKEKIDTPQAKKFLQSVNRRIPYVRFPMAVFNKQAKQKGFKSYSDYLEKWAKDKGFKPYSDYQEKLVKGKFVSRFAALLEAGVPVEEAARITLPLAKKQFFPKRKLGFIADEAVAASKRKKLPAHK